MRYAPIYILRFRLELPVREKKERCPEPDSAMVEYQHFLQEGQARLILALRESRGQSRKDFAAGMGIPPSSLRAWEAGKKTVSFKSWKRYFRGRL